MLINIFLDKILSHISPFPCISEALQFLNAPVRAAADAAAADAARR